MKIIGYVPVGIARDVDYYFSKKSKKFVDSVDKLMLSDLFLDKELAEKVDLKKYPLIDKYKGVVKITLEIEL